jgi:predicted CoA-binding protein
MVKEGGLAISALQGARAAFTSLLPHMPDSTVAVIGASRDRRKYGNKAVRAYLACGFTVFPVNPTEATIEGLKAYPTLDAIAEPIDFVSLYVPPAVGLKLLPAIAAKQPKELWLNPGAESDELIEGAADRHLRAIVACSIMALGQSPRNFPDA